MVKALETKKRDEIVKAITTFEREADPKFITQDDKEFVEKIKTLISNKDKKSSITLIHYIKCNKIIF